MNANRGNNGSQQNSDTIGKAINPKRVLVGLCDEERTHIGSAHSQLFKTCVIHIECGPILKNVVPTDERGGNPCRSDCSQCNDSHDYHDAISLNSKFG